MFGWFSPKCPVDAASRNWIDARMSWLVGQFGRRQLEQCPVVLPTDEFFPEPFDGTTDSARTLFCRTCGYMGVDPGRIELKFYVHGGGQLPWKKSLGLYDDHDGVTTVWIEKSRLSDPESLVATSAHELCHVRLLGEKRISPEEADMEELTDLATVFFGLGIFSANAFLHDRSYHVTNWEFWSISRAGYLAAPLWGYALALFARLREEANPIWLRFLRPDIRKPFRTGLAFLNTSDEVDRRLRQIRDGSMPQTAPPPAFDRRSKDNAELPENATADAAGDLDETQRLDHEVAATDEWFTAGTIHARYGRWAEAVAAFSACIQRDPNDGDAYQQRSLAYLALGELEKAFVDAIRAVDLDPDASESYWARGLAYLRNEDFVLAIEDFARYIKEEHDRSSPARAAQAFCLRGRAYAGLGDLERAIRDYTSAIYGCPTWPEPYEARAEAYAQLGLEEKAQVDRKEADRWKRS